MGRAWSGAPWTGQTLKEPTGQCPGPVGGGRGPQGARGVVSWTPAEQGGSRSGPAGGRAHSWSRGATEAGRVLGLQEDRRPLRGDTVSTHRLPRSRERGSATWVTCEGPSVFGVVAGVRVSGALVGVLAVSWNCFLCLLTAWMVWPSWPRCPRCFPTAAWKGGHGCRREVRSLPWGLDPPPRPGGRAARAPQPTWGGWFSAWGPTTRPPARERGTLAQAHFTAK